MQECHLSGIETRKLYVVSYALKHEYFNSIKWNGHPAMVK